MDAINNILQINDIINIHDDLNIQIPERAPVQHRVRGNLLDIPDREFKMRYRFDKDHVVHLANMLAPHLVRNDVHHGYQRLTPLETVCSALDILGGGHFQRVEGVCANMCTTSAHRSLHRFVGALNTFKNEVIHMPTRAEQDENRRSVLEKYNLPNVVCAIDGCHIPWDGTPREILDSFLVAISVGHPV